MRRVDLAERSPSQSVDLGMRMELRISPAQLLLAELLPLAASDLQERVEVELAANPALELPAPATCPRCGYSVWRGVCAACADVGRDRQCGEFADRTADARRCCATHSARSRPQIGRSLPN